MFKSEKGKKRNPKKDKKSKNNDVESEGSSSDGAQSHEGAAPTVSFSTQNKDKKKLKKTTMNERKDSESNEDSDSDREKSRNSKKKSKKVDKEDSDKEDSDKEIKPQKSSKNNKLSEFVKKDFKFSAIEISPLEILKFEPSNKEYVRWFTKGKEIERVLLGVSFALFEEFKGKYNTKFSSSAPHELLISALNLAENGLPIRELPVEIIELIDLIKTQYIFDIIKTSDKYKDYIGCLLLNIIKKSCKIKIKSSQNSIEGNEWKGIANCIRANIVIKGILHTTDKRKAFDNTFGFIIEGSKVGIRYVNEQAKIAGPQYNELEMEELKKELKCKEEKINKQQEYIKLCEDFIEKVTSNLEQNENIKNIFKKRDNCEVRVLEHLTKEAKGHFKSALSEYKEMLKDKLIKDCDICNRGGDGIFKLWCQHHSHGKCVKK